MGYKATNNGAREARASGQYGVNYSAMPGETITIEDPRAALNLELFGFTLAASDRRQAVLDVKSGVGFGAKPKAKAEAPAKS